VAVPHSFRSFIAEWVGNHEADLAAEAASAPPQVAVPHSFRSFIAEWVGNHEADLAAQAASAPTAGGTQPFPRKCV